MTRPARAACARAVAIELAEGSTPMTAAPSLAISSASRPPPQPTSITTFPAGSRPAAANADAKYSSRAGFSDVRMACSGWCSSHQMSPGWL